VVLVERGWVPRDMHERERLPDVPATEGEVTVVGRVSAGLSRTFQLGSEVNASPGTRGPLLRQNTDVAFWRQWLGQAPLAGAVLQVQAETPVGMADNARQGQMQQSRQELRRHWPEPGAGRDRHLAYAAQWFAMAALLAALTVWFQIIRPHRQASSSHVPS
jgi:surfeit locus 1 family protein